MRKLTVAALVVGTFLVYSVMHSQSNGAALAPRTATDTAAETSTSTPTTPTPALTEGGDDSRDQVASAPTPTTPPSNTTTTPTATTTSGGQFTDGSYTGNQADAQWGYVQVRVTIAKGKISNVQFLEYPNDRSRSRYINSFADPELINEAIQAQSAQVDIVTGATDSSQAFIESLTNALAQAQS